MPKWTCNENESKNLFGELNSYMQKKVFGEKFQDTIPDGLKGVPEEVLDIQLPHVGINYAMKRNGNPFRIAIFGIEPGARGLGDSGNWDMKIKREITEEFNEKPYTRFNPHMKGTLHTLQLLFGLPVDGDSREIEIDGGRKCKIFDAFCLSNARLYRETSEKSSESAGPIADEIWKNCKRHFKKTIEILQPQIVILQGGKAERMVDHVYDLKKEYKKEKRYHIIKEDGKEARIAERGEIPKIKIEAGIDELNLSHGKTLFLSIYHPTAWEGKGYSNASANKDGGRVQTYLKPTISKLLEKYKEIWG